jgi:hypothetical protein
MESFTSFPIEQWHIDSEQAHRQYAMSLILVVSLLAAHNIFCIKVIRLKL